MEEAQTQKDSVKVCLRVVQSKEEDNSFQVCLQEDSSEACPEGASGQAALRPVFEKRRARRTATRLVLKRHETRRAMTRRGAGG